MPMKPKTGYISQKELLFSAVAYSPTQDVSFLVGTSVPFAILSAIYVDPSPLLGIAGFRYGTKVHENLYMGAGIEAFLIAGESVSIPFVNATYGNPEQHITIGGGVGLRNFEVDQAQLAPFFVSAYQRISPSLAFITENWLLTSPSYNYVSTDGTESYCDPYYYDNCEMQYDWGQLDLEMVASSIGVRFISTKFTTDIGLINVFGPYGDYVPIPWLDVSWYFGDSTPQ